MSKNYKEMVKVYGLGLFAGCLILIGAYQFVAPAPPDTVRIATAGQDGAYYAFAKEYQQYFREQKIDLQIIPTSGSVENLELLADNRVEIAFIQGGVGRREQYPEFEGLAALYLEPLFVFARRDIQIRTLLDLKGKRLAIGPEGSGTRSIVLQLLQDNHLSFDEDLSCFSLAGKEGAQALLAGEIDVFFMVTRPGSLQVEELLKEESVQLVSIARAEAYSRLHPFLSHIVIPQGVLDMEMDIPSRDIHFIAPAATLVANQNLHPALVDLFMQVSDKVHGESSILGKERKFPAPEYLDFPLNTEAERFFKHGPPFLQRYLPFWAASLVDRIKFMFLPLVALGLPLMKVLPPALRWRIRSRIYRWYDELHELDQVARQDGSEEGLQDALDRLERMEQEVRLVEVPLSYAEELYHLRLHIDMLRKQLTKLQHVGKLGSLV